MKPFAWGKNVALLGIFLLVATGAQEKQSEKKPKPSSSGEEKPAKTANENLPTAEEILNRFGKEIGGVDTFAEKKSQHAKGAVEMPGQNISGKMEIFATRPNKMIIKMDMAGVGQITTGFDGKVGWMSSPLTGPMLLPEKSVEQMAAQADFDHALHRPEDYKSMEVLGVEEFAGEPCYKLKLVHRTGFETTEYFSKKSGLQKGFESNQESPFGPVNVTTVVAEYKKFDGILMPSKVVQKMSGMEQTLTIDEMEFNTVAASEFEVPEEVKALIAK